MSAASPMQPVKFDFGQTFDELFEDEHDDVLPGRRKERTWNEEQVAAERAEAMRQGIEQGRAEALAGIEQKIADSNAAILQQISRIAKQLEAVSGTHQDEARTLALLVARKIASDLLVRMHQREVEAIVADALALLPNQPHVVIRVNEDLIDGFKLRFEAIAEECGFQGKLIILGEPDIDAADCRVEWADGGICRDTARLEQEIHRIVARHMRESGRAQPETLNIAGPAVEPAGTSSQEDRT